MGDEVDVVNALSSAGGSLLAAGTRALAALRSVRKPLHPIGEATEGLIRRWGSDEVTGVAWIDEAGEDEVLVRRSRAIGLPRGMPDIHGVAIRIRGEVEDRDLLFASTGLGRITRFTLTVSRLPRGRPLTTLLPYDTDSGALMLAIDGTGTGPYDLSWARPSGRWHRFGELHLSGGPGSDPDISFDPILRQVPGLRQYPVVRHLREPAYVRARKSRNNPTTAMNEESDHVH